jgi:hypothetical protein
VSAEAGLGLADITAISGLFVLNMRPMVFAYTDDKVREQGLSPAISD